MKPLFASAPFRAFELSADHVPELQRFFEANPEYHQQVGGTDPGPDEAREDFESMPPADWPCGRKWVIGFRAPDGSLVAMADLLENVFVEGVWHVGLFVMATPYHRTGTARRLYDALEHWMRSRGATWVRLGVAIGNRPAERFWEKAGFRDVRLREGVTLGRRVHTIRVMLKPLGGESLADYLARVARDRPDQNPDT